MFRRRQGQANDLDDIPVVLHEQIQFVNDMKEKNTAQNQFHQKIFMAFGIIFAMTKFYGVVSSILFPYNMTTHMYLYGIASPITIAIAEAISGISFFATFYFMSEIEEHPISQSRLAYTLAFFSKNSEKRKQMLTISVIIGILQFIFWGFILSAPYLHAFWFGGGNVTFACICAFIKQSMEETDAAISGLFEHVTPQV